MSQQHQRRQERKRRLWIAIAVSLGLHLLLAAALLPRWIEQQAGGITRGSPEFVLINTEPTRRSKTPSPEPPTKQVTTPQPAARQPTRDRPRRATEVPSELPADMVSTFDGDQVTPSPTEVEAAPDSGHPSGDADGLVLTPGYGVLQGSVTPRPECLDNLDNDGDHLVDTEDPGCLPPPATAQEEAEMRARAMLLSDMRASAVSHEEVDPDERLRQKMHSQITVQDDHLVYRDGSFGADIGPDGSVRFQKGRSVGFGNGGLTFGGGSGPGFRARDKLRFLEATEEIRDERDRRARQRMMSKALFGLRGSLEEIWADRQLSLEERKAILFQRLDECDTSTPGGRQAAKVIVEFIRDHSQQADDDRRARSKATGEVQTRSSTSSGGAAP